MKKQSIPMLAHIAVDTIFKKDNQILLLRRSQTFKVPGQYSFIGGKCDEGESIVETAIREAYEEIGVVIRSEDLTFAHVVQKRMKSPHKDWIFFFFVVETWQGDITNKETEKHESVGWFDINKLPTGFGPIHHKALIGWQNKSLWSISYDEM